MEQEISSKTEITLEIQNTAIKCNKEQLMANSDYFKVMFEGNFVEHNKTVIKLEGISLTAMNTILRFLWDMDNTLLIEKEEDTLEVLQASCMLQFVTIQVVCIERLLNILSPSNCLKIWLLTEQLDLKPLYLKAKNMALIEFETIKNFDSFLMELSLKELYLYLANTNLQCSNEMGVFQVCMKWWYHNSGKFSQETCTTEIFTCLLSCLDFNELSTSDIQEMVTYPDLSRNNEIIDILNCIIDKRSEVQGSYKESVVGKAEMFMKSKSRRFLQLPCIVFHDEMINCNGFNRLAKFAHYDDKCNGFQTLFRIEKEKCNKLEGFHLIGYKELIFLFGGEYVMGHGTWNKNFWVYDSIKEGWERKSVLPFVRRHFQLCIGGTYLFVVGGTGPFRVLQENIFWYNYKSDKWSNLISLPCSSRQIKCCSYNEQLMVLNINEKNGYIFDVIKESWTKIEICDNKKLVPRFSAVYSVFTYKNSIFLKGDYLIEMKVRDQKLIVVNCTSLEPKIFDEIESVISGNMVYTLYKHLDLGKDNDVSFETYNMESQDSTITIPIGYQSKEEERTQHHIPNILFGFQHYKLVSDDTFVNELP